MKLFSASEKLKKGEAYQKDTIEELVAGTKIIPENEAEQLHDEYDHLEKEKASLEKLEGFQVILRSGEISNWNKQAKLLNRDTKKSSSTAVSRLLRQERRATATSSTGSAAGMPGASGVQESHSERRGQETTQDHDTEFEGIESEDHFDSMLYTEDTNEMLKGHAIKMKSEEECNRVQRLTGDEARDQVEHLDKVLRIVQRRGDYKHVHQVTLGLLRRLCGDNGIYPKSFRLKGVKPSEVELGKGGYGIVSLGTWGGQTVAVKNLIAPRNTFDIRTSCKEAAVWAYARHPNITPFYGISALHEQSAPCLVSKCMSNGTVKSYLEARRSTNRPKLVSGVAAGLEYLHDRSILHGDLKCDNILVDEDGNPCLADFGLAALKYDDNTTFIEVSSRNGDGTTLWTAPEILYPGRFKLERALLTKESDIWSFSLVMWEIFTGTFPFKDIQKPNQGPLETVDRVSRGHRTARPARATALGLSDGMWSIMERCLQATPALRPSIASIREELELLLKDFDSDSLETPDPWPLEIDPAPSQ